MPASASNSWPPRKQNLQSDDTLEIPRERSFCRWAGKKSFRQDEVVNRISPKMNRDSGESLRTRQSEQSEQFDRHFTREVSRLGHCKLRGKRGTALIQIESFGGSCG